MAQLIGMSQGPAGSGAKARMSYYEKQEAIRDKHEANLNAIDDASILTTTYCRSESKLRNITLPLKPQIRL